MKMLLLALLCLSAGAFGQSINKAWIDNQAKMVNPAFEQVTVHYYINNSGCESDSIDAVVRDWSPAFVSGIDVIEVSPVLENYFPAFRSCWIVKITGCADPVKKCRITHQAVRVNLKVNE